MRFAVFFALAATAFCGDWNRKSAAEYLDARQKEWFGWKAAEAKGGPCMSCHTGLPYLLVRPALSKALGEPAPAPYLKGLADSLRARLDQSQPRSDTDQARQSFGVESVLAAVTLSLDDPSGPDAKRALDRMWTTQLREGPSQGAWHWFHLDLDPWENESKYFGASLAAFAVGNMEASYRSTPAVKERVQALTAYLTREFPKQPLHNRLTLLWASARLREAMPKAARKETIAELWRLQQPDGGWTLPSLGPWTDHPKAPPMGTSSNAYATSYVTFALQRAGAKPSDARLGKAIAWLKSQQGAEGFWQAESMNKVRPPESIPANFMRVAATSYAAAALLEHERK